MNTQKTVFNTAITIFLCCFLGCGSTDVSDKSQKIEENKIGASLQDILIKDSSHPNYVQEDEFISVVIGLTDEGEKQNTSSETGTIFEDGKIIINGREVTEEELEAINEKAFQHILASREARMKRRQVKLQELAKRNGWEQHPAIIAAIAADSDVFSVIVPIKKGDILGFIQKNQDIIDGVELYVEPQDE